jgi:ketosteroid isomerase-like protein
MSKAIDIEQLAEQVEVLSARASIWELMSRYARALDEEDDSELNAIYTEDATCETVPWSQGVVRSGKESTVRVFKGYQKRFINRKRFITNEVIDITGRDTATGWSNWLVLHSNSGDSFVGWGSYDWGFRRVDGNWLISAMVIKVDCMTTLERGWGDAEKLLAGFPDKPS